MLDWFKILKWLALVALAIAIVAVPVVYINHAVSSAKAEGYTQGYATKQHEVDLIIQKQQADREDTANREAAQALERQKDRAKYNTNVFNLQKKLEDALKNNPAPVGCLLNDNATSVLRSAAEGQFDGESPIVSGRPAPEMSPVDPVPDKS